MKKIISFLMSAVLLIFGCAVRADAADDAGYRLIGDVDEDGSVTITDATTIQRALAAFVSLTPLQRYLGDVDGNGVLEITDATVIQRRLAALGDTFHTEKLTTWKAQKYYTLFRDNLLSIHAGEETTFTAEKGISHPVSNTYAFYVDGELKQGFSEEKNFTYVFPSAGKYVIEWEIRTPFGDSMLSKAYYTVEDAFDPSVPNVWYANIAEDFDTMERTLTISAKGGAAPYEYRCELRIFKESGYFTDETWKWFDDSEEPGYMMLVWDYSPESTVPVPYEMLSDSMGYIITVYAKDSDGSVSAPAKFYISR